MILFRLWRPGKRDGPQCARPGNLSRFVHHSAVSKVTAKGDAMGLNRRVYPSIDRYPTLALSNDIGRIRSLVEGPFARWPRMGNVFSMAAPISSKNCGKQHAEHGRAPLSQLQPALITPGKYSAWFRTPVGEGAATVEFSSDGKLTGGDTTFSYSGTWAEDGKSFKAGFTARRFAPGPPGVFGLDEIDIIVSRRSDGGTLTGFAKQAPGLKLEVELIQISEPERLGTLTG
jgi:hypothetical protein